MKAVVMRGKRRVETEDVPTPEPGPDQVLVKVTYSGVCGSDVHRFQYGMAEPGAIMGHEFCGTIAARGRNNVTRWKGGDRVVGGGGAPPGSRARAPANPRHSARTVGFEAYAWGGFAEYVVGQVLVADGAGAVRHPARSSGRCHVEPMAVAGRGGRP